MSLNDPFRSLNLLFDDQCFTGYISLHLQRLLQPPCYVFIVCVKSAGLFAYIITQRAHTVCALCLTVSALPRCGWP